MNSFLIRGGVPLKGTIEISGSKNSSLPILAACLMIEGPMKLLGVPRLSDIDSMLTLLKQLGCSTRRHEAVATGRSFGPLLSGQLDIEVHDESSVEASYDVVKTMRASICVLGPLLARRGRAIVSIPGGCAIGDRPIDLHLRGLQKLGATVRTENGRYICETPGNGTRRLKGATMYLGGTNGPTVLGTINVMCAATLAQGKTRIVGAACEPEVADCASMLNKCGAKITGAGTTEITIEGVEKLTAHEHRIIPDRIETGTFLMAAAVTGGSLTLRRANLDHLIAVVDILQEAGVSIVADVDNDTVRVTSTGRLKPVDIATHPYPGFPTDLQAPLMALLTTADGISVISERIYGDRFTHIGELTRMGAFIRKEGPTAIIAGVSRLQTADVMCSDLRAGAALVVAALGATGTTRLDRIYHIDRGYEKLEAKLASVGADIERVDSRSADKSETGPKIVEHLSSQIGKVEVSIHQTPRRKKVQAG